jgi:hypothetical protein
VRFSEIAERLCDACLAKFGPDPIPEQVCPKCRKRLEKLLAEWRRELIEHLEEEGR